MPPKVPKIKSGQNPTGMGKKQVNQQKNQKKPQAQVQPLPEPKAPVQPQPNLQPNLKPEPQNPIDLPPSNPPSQPSTNFIQEDQNPQEFRFRKCNPNPSERNQIPVQTKVCFVSELGPDYYAGNQKYRLMKPVQHQNFDVKFFNFDHSDQRIQRQLQWFNDKLQRQAQSPQQGYFKRVETEFKFCEICRVGYTQYLEHISTLIHKTYVKKNRLTSFINDLTAKYVKLNGAGNRNAAQGQAESKQKEQEIVSAQAQKEQERKEQPMEKRLRPSILFQQVEPEQKRAPKKLSVSSEKEFGQPLPSKRKVYKIQVLNFANVFGINEGNKRLSRPYFRESMMRLNPENPQFDLAQPEKDKIQQGVNKILMKDVEAEPEVMKKIEASPEKVQPEKQQKDKLIPRRYETRSQSKKKKDE